MIRHRWWILLFALVVFLSASSVMAGGDVNVYYGQKRLNEGAFDDVGVADQPQFGIILNVGTHWPVALAIDVLSSSDDRTEAISATFPITRMTEVSTLEVDLGVRKVWEKKRWRPFLGGGLSRIQGDVKQTTSTDILGNIVKDTLIDDDESGIGFWLGGGTFWTSAKGFNIGLDVRYSNAKAEFTAEGFTQGQDFDLGGFALGLMLGYHW